MRIRIGGTWHHVGNLGDYPLSRVHSVTYEHGHVWQIAFDSALLELTAEEALEFKAAVAGIDDALMKCNCSAPRYDGDDGYNRDCPMHGYEES